MILFLDHAAVSAARLINVDRMADTRHYYLISTPAGDAIIVVRDGHTLEALRNQRVDATVGWDIAQPGFAREEQIGQQRTKVTIFKPWPRSGRAKSLSQLLGRKQQNADL